MLQPGKVTGGTGGVTERPCIGSVPSLVPSSGMNTFTWLV